MGLTRRGLLAGLGLTVVGRVDDAPVLPGGLRAYRQAYRNWSGELVVDGVWTCAPGTAADVVALANWARGNGYTLRAQGYRHGWSPLTLTSADRVLLVDTTQHLTGMAIEGSSVRVQTGASMEALLGFLESAGYGVTATPAPGDVSVGGVLAIDGHGTAVPAVGEAGVPGTTYGSLSNLVLELTAVVWDPGAGAYVARTFTRDDPDCAAFLTHLGRAFLTEVRLSVGANAHLRCVSRVDIPAAELFAAPGQGGRTLASFLDTAGRVEAIWFAFTADPWLKVWSVAPDLPLGSRPVTGPYNYPFSDNVPEPVAALAGRIVAGEYYLAPVFGQAQYDTTAAGLTATLSADIWGPSKDVLLYIRPTTIRMHANGYAVAVARAGVQDAVHRFTEFYSGRLAAYAAAGRYPVNGTVEIRVTGLDVGFPVAPALSALAPRAGHPEWDTAVWFDVLTLPGTADAFPFYRELEQFLFAAFPGAVRAEWSKGWAYTDTAAWADPLTFQAIRATYPWDDTLAVLDRYDPGQVFASPLISRAR
jgi:FAD/FMN-containing dehydrogenase